MIKILFLLGTVFLYPSAFATEVDDLRKIISIQQAQLQKVETDLNAVSAKLSKFISDDGIWKGQNSGLVGKQGERGLQGMAGVQGIQGIQGPAGTSLNFTNTVIVEATSCSAFCAKKFGTFCVTMTGANWDSASPSKCEAVNPVQKRCVCAGW